MSDSDENPIPPSPVPPADDAPVPPAQHPVPPADAMPVPPAQQPVHPAHQPIPPAEAMPVPPAQETYAPVPPHQIDPNQVPLQQPTLDALQHPQEPAIQPPAINQNPALPPVNQPVAAAAGGAAAQGGRVPKTGGRRPARKKKVARKGGRPSYKRPVKSADSGFSFSAVFMALVGLLMLGGSAVALLPQSLSHIAGYPTDVLENKEPKNLLAAAQAILETREGEVMFTEKEVNDYLNFRLQGAQKGALGGIMKIKGVYVDLRPKEAEIFIERSFPLIGSTTISSVVKSQYNDIKHQQYWKLGGGSIGRFSMKERSLQPVLDAFIRMGRVGGAELEVMNYMADVKIGEDKITLDAAL